MGAKIGAGGYFRCYRRETALGGYFSLRWLRPRLLWACTGSAGRAGGNRDQYSPRQTDTIQAGLHSCLALKAVPGSNATLPKYAARDRCR